MLSDAWVSALALYATATKASAKTAVSTMMRWLENRNLITRARSQRLSDVVLLKEDGSGDPYNGERSNCAMTNRGLFRRRPGWRRDQHSEDPTAISKSTASPNDSS